MDELLGLVEMYLPEPIQIILQQDVIQIVRNDMAEGLTLTFVHIHSTSHELIKRLDRVTDGLDLVIDQLLFRFLFHRLVKAIVIITIKEPSKEEV